MGRFVFKLPDVGEGTAEAEIVAWHVKVGDVVSEDAPLVDVMTDKATVEMTSPVAGKVVELDIAETDRTKAEETARQMAQKLLANQVIEDYRITVL